MRTAGFVLLEYSIYSASMVVICVVLFTLSGALQHLGTRMSAKAHAYMSLYAASDVLARDLRKAPCAYRDWYVVQPDRLIWHDKNRDSAIGWQLEKGRLMRYSGTYHPLSKTWQAYTKSLIAQHIQRWQCTPLYAHGTTMVRGIWSVVYNSSADTCKQFVAVSQDGEKAHAE